MPLAPQVCASVRPWLAYLDKIIADEVQLSADDTGAGQSGCIWAESAPGHGATFRFSLPAG